jgi:hypothetical protein
VSQPPSFNRAFSFSNFQAGNPSAALPGVQVDGELNNAKATFDAILANLKKIQRDDGQVANASIGLDQLSAQVPLGFNAPVVWSTGTAFAANSSTVFNGSGFYRCLVAHTSGVFATDLAAGLWQLIVNLAAVPLVAANQIAVTPSGSLTTDVQGSLQALDTGKAPLSHTQLSSTISDSTAAGRALLTAADVPTQQGLLGISTLGFQPGNIKETAGILLESGWYWCDGSAKNRVTDAPLFNAITIQQTGTLTSTSAVVTGLADTSNMSPGMPISAAGAVVPAATVIQSVDSGTQITMSAAATGSGATALTIAPYGVGDGTTTFGLPNRAYLGVGRDNASGSASNINQVSTTITLTSGSNTATVGSAAGLCAGMFISTPKLPFGTFIGTISGTTITMSSNATASVGPVAASFSPVRNAQTLGSIGGALSQSTTLVTANLPPYTPAGSIAVTNGAITISPSNVLNPSAGGALLAGGGSIGSGVVPTASQATSTAAFTGTAQGGTGTAFKTETVQPTIVMNYIIKR